MASPQRDRHSAGKLVTRRGSWVSAIELVVQPIAKKILSMRARLLLDFIKRQDSSQGRAFRIMCVESWDDFRQIFEKNVVPISPNVEILVETAVRRDDHIGDKSAG
jgi:hypothetical protein